MENRAEIFSRRENLRKILSEDIPSTIEFLKTECAADEFSWISEVIDDVVDKARWLDEILVKEGYDHPVIISQL